MNRMRSIARLLVWIVVSIVTVAVGLYPFAYLVFDMSGGFPSIKDAELLQSALWNAGFYLHIVFGGIALLTGLSQFSEKLRNRRRDIHRTLGKVYLISVAISGIGGLYIAMFATGGLVSIAGFTTAFVLWLFSTREAYRAVRRRAFTQHKHWMMRSYAICFGAVTLRLWAPLLQFGVGLEFIVVYRMITWLSWVPNLLVAEMIIGSMKRTQVLRSA